MEIILELLKKQRQTFTRKNDFSKDIHNLGFYKVLDYEIEKEQKKIGKEKKTKIIIECKKKGIKIPNFRREGMTKILLTK